MSKQKLLIAGTLAALCLMAAFSMQAKAAGQDGMTVARDPQTGKLRPATPQETNALRAKAPATAGATAPRAASLAARRDGARGVRLGEKTMVYEVVTRGPDGKLSSQCVQGAGAAAEALAHPADLNDVNARENAHESR